MPEKRPVVRGGWVKKLAEEAAELPSGAVWWEYIGEELAVFWISPYGHGKEKIATFWWPAHPPDATAQVEAAFEAIAGQLVTQTRTISAAEPREAVTHLNTVGWLHRRAQSLRCGAADGKCTTDPAAVTCQECKRLMEGAA